MIRFAAQYAERNGGVERSQEVVSLPMYVAAVFLLAATHHKVRPLCAAHTPHDLLLASACSRLGGVMAAQVRLGRRELQKVCLVTEKQLDRVRRRARPAPER